MKILVTGAGGFTGGHLVRHLVHSSLDALGPASNLRIPAVRAMVRTEKQKELLLSQGAEAVVADLTDPESLKRALDGVSLVYHVGALFRQAGRPDKDFYDINVEGTKNLFEASLAAGVRRIIHCSTVGVSGDIVSPPGNELTPYAPGDIYQQTKMEGERIALAYFRSGKIGGVVIRPAMIYGPGDRRTLKLFKRVADRNFFYVGRGDKHVHFVDVRDLSRAFVLAMEHTERNGEVYIIASRESKPLTEMVAAIADYFGVKPPRLHIPVLPMQTLGLACELICKPFGIEPPIFRRRVDFFTKHREFCWEKAKKELGYYPRNSFHEEIREICHWYLSEGWIKYPNRQAGLSSATIIRDINGCITHWDAQAEQSYGWKAAEAIGSVTHSLLRTEFPTDLKEINRQILTDRVWEGALVHTTREGEKIRVMSRWEYVGESDESGLVIEKNRIIEVPPPAGRMQELPQRIFMLVPSLPEFIETGLMGLSVA